MSSDAVTPSVAVPARVSHERRQGTERRRLTLWTLVRGGCAPRRRGSRRGADVTAADRYPRGLVGAAIVAVVLSAVDANLTLILLARGAVEINPLMAVVLAHHPQLFAVLKMSLTSLGVVLLVLCSPVRLGRLIRVGNLIYGVAFGYLLLVVYECWLLTVVV